MFNENTDHLQENFFGVTTQLSAQQQKRLNKSREHFLFENFFIQIDEQLFEPLYADNNNDWSIDFLMDQVNFNLLTRTALGLKTLESVPFCEATYYNFQHRLFWYQFGKNSLR